MKSNKSDEELLKDLVEELKQKYYEEEPGASRRTTTWAETAFQNLRGIMIREGYSIGINTLREIMTYKYVINSNRQRVRTLDVCVMFLGYDNWKNFVESALGDSVTPHQDAILNTVIQGNYEILQSYKKLPEIQTRQLEKYFLTDTSFFEKLRRKLITRAGLQVRLNKDEIYTNDAVIKYYKNRKAGVETSESWDINWLKLNGSTFPELPYPTKHYLFILYYNGKKWKIEGKYELQKSFEEDSKPMYLKVPEECETIRKLYVEGGINPDNVGPLYHSWYHTLFEERAKIFD